jgi:hypothetical protein
MLLSLLAPCCLSKIENYYGYSKGLDQEVKIILRCGFVFKIGLCNVEGDLTCINLFNFCLN